MIDLDGTKFGSKPTVFRYLIHKSQLSEADKNTHRLANEAQSLLGAGSVTTARSATMSIFYILKVPKFRRRVEEELKDIMSDWPNNPPTWPELEKLPFMQAVIRESLRYVGLLRKLLI